MQILSNMLAHERQQQILSALEERGTVRTIDLAEEFQVTDETIRRDLQVLSDAQSITRIHGGASLLNGRRKLQSFSERSTFQVDQKRAIAKAAIELIKAGKTYAFDSSTTGFELVRTLPDLSYSVVTNAYAVLDHLVHMKEVTLISTGGRYHPKTQTFVSGDSYKALKRHNINTAFISCLSLDAKQGASEGFEEQAIFKEYLVEMAEEVVLLVDSSKLNQRSEYFFASAEDISSIITDSDADPKFVEDLRSRGYKVVIA